MQRALRNVLMTENGREKLDNELITTLFENITTRAQLHQFTRAEEKKINKGQATYPEETLHNSIGHGIQVSTSNTHLWLLSRRVCLHHRSWPMLCTHRTTQEQSTE